MAFQGGVFNAGAFMACHRFVSHVTGFATFFGYEINQKDTSHAWGMLIVPLFFLLGCIVSGILVDVRLRLHKRPKYYISFGLIFLLSCVVLALGVSGYLGPFGKPLTQTRDLTLLILLCLICGIQNATITTVSKSIIRTTHLTGVTTDLGIALVRLAYRKKIKIDVKNEAYGVLIRLGIILFFVMGSVGGVFLFMRQQYLGFIAPVLTSGFLFALMLTFQLIRPKRISQGVAI